MQRGWLDADYWDKRYQDDSAAWDLGKVSPPLMAYFDQVNDKTVRLLLPGCGNAWEAAYLLHAGFTNITVLDIAPELVLSLKGKFKYAEENLKIVCADFFEFRGKFDLVIEQTFFCALPPELRAAYVSKMYELLLPGGKLVGVLFDRGFEGGPPFGGTETEYRELFNPYFEIKTMSSCYNSIPPRQGSELFVILEKRAASTFK